MTRGCPNFNDTVLGDGRLHHPLDAVAAQATVVAHAFDFQQAPIDLVADLAQVRQIAQAFVDPEVVRVSERAFGSASPPLLEILFQVEVLVLDVQAGMHPVLDHPRAERPRRLLGHHPIEDQLHPVGPPQIQVVANDFFEEFTSA